MPQYTRSGTVVDCRSVVSEEMSSNLVGYADTVLTQ